MDGCDAVFRQCMLTTASAVNLIQLFTATSLSYNVFTYVYNTLGVNNAACRKGLSAVAETCTA